MSFITKLKSALGNSKSVITTDSSDNTEAIIKDIEHIPFAISENNVLYAGLNELGGYFIFQTVVVGAFQIKTKKGGQLILIGNDFELQLDSDSMEFESDSTDIQGRSITKIDFQIEEDDATKISQSRIDELILKCKSQKVLFTNYKGNDKK